MLVWYSSPQMRRQLLSADSQTVLDALVDEAMTLLTSWSPAGDYQWSVVHGGRVVDWLVWRTAVGAHDEWTRVFNDPEVIEPWAIHLPSLPRYGSMPHAILDD